MLVIYELFKNEDGKDDERNVADCDSLKEIKAVLESKFDTTTSVANLSKIIKRKGIINKKYKVFKINF